MTDNRKPIVYSQDLHAHYSDLDPYGHVNSPIYLDYLITSRWQYVAKALGTTTEELLKKGLGFFIVNTNMNYKRSIAGTAVITVDSWVSDIAGSKLTVDYEIKQNNAICSDGKILFMIMDLQTMKPQQLPEWAEYLFWED